MKPYIEKEIELLQKNLDRLVQEKEDYQSMKSIGSGSKGQILDGLRQIYIQQMN